VPLMLSMKSQIQEIPQDQTGCGAYVPHMYRWPSLGTLNTL
jgi:hypothetical protein